MKDDIRAAVDKVLESQQFIMGPEVKQLEAEIAAFIGSRFAIACASGSDALLLALMALGVDSGDEVVTPPFTFVATAGSIARLKAKPVFVDIERETYNLDPSRLEAAITSRTKAIMPVHLFGLPAEMDKIYEIARAHRVRCSPVHWGSLSRSVCRQHRSLRLLQLFPFKEPRRGG
jgi:dTDP-4-amino-4,6-dideoxygalactose transaminase